MEYTDAGAVMSGCGTWRYRLWRSWRIPFEVGPERVAVFIGLNPSTATAEQDDPTVRRCVGFALDWGMTGMEMLNLYGFRSTDPKGLWGADDPVGPETDRYLVDAAAEADIVVACWGAFPQATERSTTVVSMLVDAGVQVMTLGDKTKDGHPRHPLYLKKSATLRPWEGILRPKAR